MSTTKRKCFLITPIGGDDTPIRKDTDGIIETLIEPSLKDHNYELIVSHRIHTNGNMMTSIIKGINESDLIIANISNKSDVSNPNVMYELGVADTLGKHVILLAEKGSTIPADIVSLRRIEYENTISGIKPAKDLLVNFIREIDFESRPSNPVSLALEKINIVNSGEKSIDQIELLKEIHEILIQLRNHSELSHVGTFDRSSVLEGKKVLFSRKFGELKASIGSETGAIQTLLDNVSKDEQELIYAIYHAYEAGDKKIVKIVDDAYKSESKYYQNDLPF